MNFSNKIQFYKFLKEPQIKFLDSGSQGQCFYDRSNNKIYKIFNDFFDEEVNFDYQEEDILKFSGILNTTYMWPSDVITVDNKVIGYIIPYKRGIDLCKINPLSVNLSQLVVHLESVYEDNIIISQSGVVAYDVMYNILYGKDGVNIIDTEEILKINNRNINFAFKVFIVDNYFNEFVNQFSELREMYEDLDLESRIFIINLQKKLSEFLDFELNYLKDASNFKNKKRIKENDLKMVRLLY